MYFLSYMAIGACAGVLAGLLGVGGGIIIVPLLSFLFTAQHLTPDHVIHLSLGTSLATIVFTSISSLRAHHARGAVSWQVVRRVSAGIVIGTLGGSAVAAHLSTSFLKVFFVLFLYYVAAQMLLNIKPTPSRSLPGNCGMFCAGSTIGVISSLVGIGGGSMSVPFMVWCNMPMHTAIGTSAAIGFPIALAGAVGYIANGLLVGGLPPMTLGFLYLPALAGISVASMCTAPFGAKLAHRLPVMKLKRLFALLLIVIGTKMLFSIM